MSLNAFKGLFVAVFNKTGLSGVILLIGILAVFYGIYKIVALVAIYVDKKMKSQDALRDRLLIQIETSISESRRREERMVEENRGWCDQDNKYKAIAIEAMHGIEKCTNGLRDKQGELQKEHQSILTALAILKDRKPAK